MPVDEQIARVSINWTATTPLWSGEIAVNTFHIRALPAVGGGDWGQTQQIDAAETVLAALVRNWGGVQSQFGSGFGISGVKVSALDTHGRVFAEGVASPDPGVLVGTAGSILPPEVALCLSMYGYQPGTFVPQPGRARGRMYLPYLNVALCDTKGTVKQDQVLSVLQGWQAILADIDGMRLDPGNAGNGTWELGVLSTAGVGSFTHVLALACDDHFDSQRRRQHQHPATRQVVAL